MKISVFGAGYVGLVAATGFADFGHTVCCGDVNEDLVSSLKAGKVTFVEPNLEELMVRQVAAGRLSFSHDLNELTNFADVLVLAVGTPTLPSGDASPADPRNVLRRTLDKASKMGYTCYTHPEIEFFLFKSAPVKGEAPIPVDQGGYFDHTPAVVGHDFRRQAITLLEEMGISVEFSHHEGGPGQQEIDLRDADALTTADNIMTFRHVIKEVALDQDFYASFIPKPFTDHPGSGMHTHVSLFHGEENAFYDAKAEFNLSNVGRSFIAGILTHAAEITAVTNQWVNSYKRLHGGGEAPALVNWGPSDRGALVRLPMYKPGKENSTRIEFRSPDSACNPYLAFAVMIAAGLKGIEAKYELKSSSDLVSLPTNLNEAIKAMEKSELVRETLGEHVFEYFLRNKRAEWAEYRRQVSAYELDRYLPVL